MAEKKGLKEYLRSGSNSSVLLGAGLLMAVSAIGPGFFTQTTRFTEQQQGGFASVIVVATIFVLVAQLNVWRIIAVSQKRGQDVANAILPGLGHLVAFLVAFGGLAFNIGNIAGAAMGIQVITGLEVRYGAIIVGILGVIIFYSKKVGLVVDRFSQVTGALMLILIGYAAVASRPPVGQAITGIVTPFLEGTFPFMAVLTIIGGTVGGYITFSGAHRLVDAGLVGTENLKRVTNSSIMGVSVATLIRILLFLGALGTVITHGVTLDPSNPARTVFETAGGQVGLIIFGVVFFSESLNSVVGAAYTSVSFLKTLFKPIGKHENWVIIGFILASALILIILDRNPVTILILAGSLNGLILPITLGTILIASKRKDIVGDYKHPMWLLIAGVVVVLVTAYFGVNSARGIAQLWQS